MAWGWVNVLGNWVELLNIFLCVIWLYWKPFFLCGFIVLVILNMAVSLCDIDKLLLIKKSVWNVMLVPFVDNWLYQII